jgi:4-aminobutyrate aminotransferase-like enzyme
VIGDFHGSGLLLGIDIINSDGVPDPEVADQIMNHMREHGVLIGTTGQNYATLKIRPPIVFQDEHVEIFIAALRQAIDDILDNNAALIKH